MNICRCILFWVWSKYTFMNYRLLSNNNMQNEVAVIKSRACESFSLPPKIKSITISIDRLRSVSEEMQLFICCSIYVVPIVQILLETPDDILFQSQFVPILVVIFLLRILFSLSHITQNPMTWNVNQNEDRRLLFVGKTENNR